MTLQAGIISSTISTCCWRNSCVEPYCWAWNEDYDCAVWGGNLGICM